MKMTKEKLIEIIKEQFEAIEEEHPAIEAGQPEEKLSAPGAADKASLAKKLREISLNIKNMDLDRNEVQLVDGIIDLVLNFANDNQGAPTLLAILNFAKQRTGRA